MTVTNRDTDKLLATGTGGHPGGQTVSVSEVSGTFVMLLLNPITMKLICMVDWQEMYLTEFDDKLN